MAATTPNNQDLLICCITFGSVSSTRVSRIASARFGASRHHHRSAVCLIKNASLKTEGDPTVQGGATQSSSQFFLQKKLLQKRLEVKPHLEAAGVGDIVIL